MELLIAIVTGLFLLAGVIIGEEYRLRKERREYENEISRNAESISNFEEVTGACIKGVEYLLLDDYEGALNSFSSTQGKIKNKQLELLLMSKSCQMAGNPHEAINYITKVLDAGHTKDSYLTYRGMLRYSLLEFETAKSDFRRAFQKNKRNLVAQRMIPIVEFLTADYKSAKQHALEYNSAKNDVLLHDIIDLCDVFQGDITEPSAVQQVEPQNTKRIIGTFERAISTGSVQIAQGILESGKGLIPESEHMLLRCHLLMSQKSPKSARDIYKTATGNFKGKSNIEGHEDEYSEIDTHLDFLSHKFASAENGYRYLVSHHRIGPYAWYNMLVSRLYCSIAVERERQSATKKIHETTIEVCAELGQLFEKTGLKEAQTLRQYLESYSKKQVALSGATLKVQSVFILHSKTGYGNGLFQPYMRDFSQMITNYPITGKII